MKKDSIYGHTIDYPICCSFQSLRAIQAYTIFLTELTAGAACCMAFLIIDLLPIYIDMENKTDKNGKNTSFVEILAVLRCDFTILFRALSFSLDFIRFVHSRGIHSFTFSGGRAKCIN